MGRFGPVFELSAGTGALADLRRGSRRDPTTERQRDTLMRHAAQQESLPLYVLYNGWPIPDPLVTFLSSLADSLFRHASRGPIFDSSGPTDGPCPPLVDLAHASEGLARCAPFSHGWRATAIVGE